ncbi:hypothetical protein ACFLWG_00345 [Chloroflexota bacterium]
MNETIRSAIRRQKSVRHYRGEPVPEEVLTDVISSGEKSVALDSSIRIHLRLVKEGRLVAK